MELKVIAYARNGHTDKFGIPRQSRDESPIFTRIVFEPEFAVNEALRGIYGGSQKSNEKRPLCSKKKAIHGRRRCDHRAWVETNGWVSLRREVRSGLIR